MLYAAIAPSGKVAALGQGRDDARDQSVLKGIRWPILVPYQTLESLNGITGIEEALKSFFKKIKRRGSP